MTDKTRHMGRILAADGRAVIVAMDHGGFSGPAAGIEEPGKTLQQVVSGADAVLTTFGIALRFPAELVPAGLILRADGGTSPLGSDPARTSCLFGVEDALRLGADGLAVTVGLGLPHERETLAYLAGLGSACAQWGLVLVAEMMPGGFDNADMRTLANVKMGARIAAELGADLVKTPYVPGFEEVTATSVVPVVVPGGSRMSPDELLAMVQAAMRAGAAGVAIGRNIWQHDDPRAMVEAISTIVHGRAR